MAYTVTSDTLGLAIGPVSETANDVHEALSKAGVPNQLLTIPGGKHGDFPADQTLKAAETVREFLSKYGITPEDK